MIRHAGFASAPAILPLAIAMIEAAFGTLLMQSVGGTALPPAGFIAAARAAIALPTVAAAAEEKLRATILGAAETLSQKGFVPESHVVQPAGLDNTCGSWQAVTTVEW